ncbi:hypothetical protein [Methylobacterium ajmalii]|jgi:hypothetical protein|uniref:phage nozzle protein n=1 Tax=Methylobacterium ajmalii TaxID=2738439 RepID=UPI00190B3800|nr:hypothetical protein [Methylobacterium ajmalii]MBK3400423.1 hypothetical protein [Methylobacterium ajmalii]MBK3407535.1 hypothetical protein [Methylobacterium ajmalii]MBK3422117.1 hypothetical protein [Methylobacterium ajmalii]MBZ6416912.1 hypothetical protein [Methylobacterium sp.]
MAITSKTVPNLVQGVSQQSPQQRRDSQCELQYDCVNSPKDGAVARNGAEVVRYHAGLDLRNAYCYELIRGRQEHYLVVCRRRAEGGVTVFDLATGQPCVVTYPAGAPPAYFDSDEVAEYAFTAQTVDDYTFIANKTVRPGFTADRTLSRPREALVFFKAGGYSMTYAISILWNGVTYRWLYQTPDNSTSANAPYIATNYLAAIFYRAMSGSVPGGTVSGEAVGGVYDGNPGTGSLRAETSQDAGAAPTLPELGFSIAINGNLLRIWRNDGRNFTMDTSDSAGDTYLLCFKDTVRSFTELPRGGFQGFLLKVKAKPSSQDNTADYFVEYVAGGAAASYWQERAAPNIPYVLDPDTMPHALINTGPGLFEVRPQVWSTRIAGDGEDTAKDPSFVGKPIERMFFHKGRLAFLTEGSVIFSKARNPFTFFPDTVQTLLADAPIDITLTASEQVALMRDVAQVDESLLLWAQGAQFRVASGNDPFRQDTVEASLTTAYEFAEKANFARVGASLYFATEPNAYATVRNLLFNQGRPVGDTDVTAHISEYIPAGIKRLSPSDTGQFLFVRSGGAPGDLFVYNYLVQDRTVVQSAWNQWRFPVVGILWAAVYRLDLLLLVQLQSGVAFLKLPLSARAVDDEAGSGYRTRLDLRVTEAACSVVYDADADTTTVRLPYAVSDLQAIGWLFVSRASSAARPRGREAIIVGRTTELPETGRGFILKGDWSTTPFYAGNRIVSERLESTFYLRTEEGVVPTDSITLREFNLRYADTGYSRVEVDRGAGRELARYELHPISVGTSDAPVGAPPSLAKGTLKATLDAPHESVQVRLINDSWLPSRWQTADWRYDAVLRAKTGAGGR